VRKHESANAVPAVRSEKQPYPTSGEQQQELALRQIHPHHRSLL